MERFVKSPVEPSEEEKKALISSMGEYVLKDAADEQALKDTLCGLRAVVPEESFGKLLDKVNTARNTTFEAKDFAEPVLREEPEAQREERVLALNGNPDLPV